MGNLRPSRTVRRDPRRPIILIGGYEDDRTVRSNAQKNYNPFFLFIFGILFTELQKLITNHIFIQKSHKNMRWKATVVIYSDT